MLLYQCILFFFVESVDYAGLVVNQQTENQPNHPDNPTNDERSALIERIIQVYVKHPQSLVCLTDWVKVVNTLLEDCEKLPEGKVQLINLFRENQHNLLDIIFFIKCNKCRKGTKVQADQKKGSKCSSCNELLKTNETNFFVILPVEQQILQSIETNWNALNKFWTERIDTNSMSYTDAHDGKILRKVLDEYKDSKVNILPLCLNVDGANKFKSNSHSVWPIQLIQNCLPPYMRYIPQNIIVNGLYYHKSGGEEELNFHTYLRPLIDELNSLKNDPILLEIEESQYQFKPVVTSCAIDLPAKSKVQETKQFGGYNACTFCDIPGEKVLIEKLKVASKSSRKAEKESSAGKKKYAVRYVESGHSYKLRDEVETLETMLAVSEFDVKKPIDGIKGMCKKIFFFFSKLWGANLLSSVLNTEYSTQLMRQFIHFGLCEFDYNTRDESEYDH